MGSWFGLNIRGDRAPPLDPPLKSAMQKSYYRYFLQRIVMWQSPLFSQLIKNNLLNRCGIAQIFPVKAVGSLSNDDGDVNEDG